MRHDRRASDPWSPDFFSLAAKLENALAAGALAGLAKKGAEVQRLLRVLRPAVQEVIPGKGGEDVARFMAEQLAADVGHEPTATPRDIALKAVFLLFSIQPHSAVSRALVDAAQRAHQRTGRVLAPYIDEDDLFELLRLHLWRLKPSYFSDERLSGVRARALMTRIADNLALDQNRKVAKTKFLPLTDATKLSPAMEDRNADQGTDLLNAYMEKAVERIAGRRPRWLVDLGVEALAGRRPRHTILAEINKRFASEGKRTWSDGALRVFVHRLLIQLRSEVARIETKPRVKDRP